MGVVSEQTRGSSGRAGAGTRHQGQIWRRAPVEAPLRGSWKVSHKGWALVPQLACI
jgi:hypothetical protein